MSRNTYLLGVSKYVLEIAIFILVEQEYEMILSHRAQHMKWEGKYVSLSPNSS